MVTHQAIGIELPALLTYLKAQQAQKLLPVFIIKENGLATITAAGDVIYGPRKLQS